MTAWTKEKAAVVKQEFYKFLQHVRINSKEKGQIVLGSHLYRAQHRFFDAVFDGLTRDVHDVKHTKARQLGVTTGSRALTLFWAGIHPGLKGYMLFDTGPHLEEARLELINMVKMLPPHLNFPTIKRENRYMVELSNGTMINFAAVGVRETNSSGSLGRSSGVNFVHSSEVSSYGSLAALEAFRNSLAEDFENRLYLWESTGRGFNIWHEMVQEAKADPGHQTHVFSGWWAKDNQIIKRDDPDFQRFGTQPPSEKEAKRIAEVRERYGWQITPEQLAWVRRKNNPLTDQTTEAIDYDLNTLRLQEQPWTEDDVFLMTGSSFFEPADLSRIAAKSVSREYKPYSYAVGLQFMDCKIYPSNNPRGTELKVWDGPVAGGVYVVAADVAFGANPKNDRSAIQVLRCYSDCVEQVAEYAWPLIRTEQFSWVIASLLGWYGGDDNEVYLILEYNGPGEAVWNSLTKLKNELTFLKYMRDQNQTGLLDIFRNVSNYIYGRTDSLSPAHNLHWRTTPTTKVPLMEGLRDYTSNGRLIIKSQDTLEEMKAVTRDGAVIEAQGRKKDDRVMALAMGVRCWLDRIQRSMMTQKRTKQNEDAKRRLTISDQMAVFSQNKLDGFFAGKQRERELQIAVARRRSWRGR